jgi:hypothetical protein
LVVVAAAPVDRQAGHQTVVPEEPEAPQFLAVRSMRLLAAAAEGFSLERASEGPTQAQVSLSLRKLMEEMELRQSQEALPPPELDHLVGLHRLVAAAPAQTVPAARLEKQTAAQAVAAAELPPPDTPEQSAGPVDILKE